MAVDDAYSPPALPRPAAIERRELIRCQRPGCRTVLAERLPGGAMDIANGCTTHRDGSIALVCPNCGEVRVWRR